MFWRNKRVLLTGGHGFLGSHVRSRLKKFPLKELRAPTREEGDLRLPDVCDRFCRDMDIVIHLAGNVGGIGYNQRFPAAMFDDTMLMGIHLMRASHKAKVKKFVTVGTVCSYPKITDVPFRESDLWDGYPEETNAAYGIAKKALLVELQAYRRQYGMNGIYLIPENLYGPGDTDNPESSHVIPALIRKMLFATKKRERSITIWGTGRATREFLYVEDAARAILLAAEAYNGSEPINIGAAGEISIRELAELIAEKTGFSGDMLFDTTKPDGQPRRSLDTTKAQAAFGFRARTPFRTGLEKTVAWYRSLDISP